MRVKAMVKCIFEIEYEDDNDDIGHTKENITMSRVDELLESETEKSIQHVTILDIEKVK